MTNRNKAFSVLLLFFTLGQHHCINVNAEEVTLQQSVLHESLDGGDGLTAAAPSHFRKGKDRKDKEAMEEIRLAGAASFSEEAPLGGETPDAEDPEDDGWYIVKFKKGSMEYAERLQAAETNEEDGGERRIRKLSTKSGKGQSFRAKKENFLPKDMVEVIHANTEEEAAEWEAHDDVEYVEKGKY